MIICKKNTEFLEWRFSNKINGKSIGFVPTMGALHQGHISLVKKSILENDFTVVSIFVNPTQFNNKEDFNNYPNTLKEDIDLLQKTNCDIVCIPDVEDIYPKNEQNVSYYSFSGIEKIMEGEHRPGHFDGVATVVKKLFEIVKPSKAYFGKKDYQQLLLIKELVEILKMPIEIIGMPIFRETDGLAMSSRNMRLTKEFRNEAPLIYKSLSKAKELAKLNYSITNINNEINKIFSNSILKLEYFEVRENNSLKFANEFVSAKNYMGFISVYAGGIRLIDNIELF